MRAVEGVPVPSDAAECPYPWIKEYAVECLTDCFINGNIQAFYNKWSKPSQNCITFINFGRMIGSFQNMNGKFDRIGRCSEPSKREGTTNYWFVKVEAFIDKIEFCMTISFNEQKEIGDFQFNRCCIYHQPEYIKEQTIERISLTTKPDILLCKPVNTQNYPCILFVHTMVDKDINIRLGFTFPGKDLEFFPSQKIGIMRGTYTPEMIETQNPMVHYASKLMEQATLRDDISKIFLCIHSYASVFAGDIVRKFPGTVDGLILINPVWDVPQDSGIKNMDEKSIPTDIPILLIGSGFDQFMPPTDFKKWKEFASKHKNFETVFYDKCDHFLMECNHMPHQEEYSMFEKHMSDVPLRKIAKFIKENSK